MVGGFLCKIAASNVPCRRLLTPPPHPPFFITSKDVFRSGQQAVIVQNLIEQKSYFSLEEELAGAGFPCFLFY